MNQRNANVGKLSSAIVVPAIAIILSACTGCGDEPPFGGYPEGIPTESEVVLPNAVYLDRVERAQPHLSVITLVAFDDIMGSAWFMPVIEAVELWDECLLSYPPVQDYVQRELGGNEKLYDTFALNIGGRLFVSISVDPDLPDSEGRLAVTSENGLAVRLPQAGAIDPDSAKWLVAHELGHVLGLRDVDGLDLMNPDAIYPDMYRACSRLLYNLPVGN